MSSSRDWRRQGQENYLKGKSLSWKKYSLESDFWKHDHCSFCGARFMNIESSEILNEGYTTKDSCYWICRDCFFDFRDEFEWSVV